MSIATTLDGVRLYYETIGSGEPLLLISGRNSDHHIWNLSAGEFSRHFQVIVYDPRGTGQSDKPQQPPYTTRMFALDAIAILDHLQIPRAHAYGISMGGAICQWLGIDHSNRLGSLVMACSSAGKVHGAAPAQETKAIMAGEDHSHALELMFSKPLGFNQLQFFLSMRESAKQPMPAFAEELHAQASREHDAWDLLPAVTAPTLILQGNDDPVCPMENATLLAGRIPDAELHMFKGGRHMFFIEFRRQVNRLILDFLSRHPLSP